MNAALPRRVQLRASPPDLAGERLLALDGVSVWFYFRGSLTYAGRASAAIVHDPARSTDFDLAGSEILFEPAEGFGAHLSGRAHALQAVFVDNKLVGVLVHPIRSAHELAKHIHSLPGSGSSPSPD